MEFRGERKRNEKRTIKGKLIDSDIGSGADVHEQEIQDLARELRGEIARPKLTSVGIF